METRECMLKKVMEYDFALYDLVLYLDTHPFDEEALCLYKELLEDAKEAKNNYEKNYGPLTVKNGGTDCEWKWIENPWPWERTV